MGEDVHAAGNNGLVGRFLDFVTDPELQARWTAALTEGNIRFLA
jgi:hypothetical protein